jgi:phosphomannomutase
MNRVYIFDVDGTLTKSRLKMTEEFEKYFTKWADSNIFYLVSGSDLDKMKEQVPQNILDKADGLFCCAGNNFYDNKKDGILTRENKFEDTEEIIKWLQDILDNNKKLYPKRFGNHIENRGSMINFSVIGRKCSYEEREIYFDFDRERKERSNIVALLKNNFEHIDASIGGQISIDIYPKGNDKSQVIDIVKNRHEGVDEYVFVGDRVRKGGNDYPLAKIMREMSGCAVLETRDPSDTERMLKRLEELND